MEQQVVVHKMYVLKLISKCNHSCRTRYARPTYPIGITFQEGGRISFQIEIYNSHLENSKFVINYDNKETSQIRKPWTYFSLFYHDYFCKQKPLDYKILQKYDHYLPPLSVNVMITGKFRLI